MTGGSSGGPWLGDTTNPGTTEGAVASLNSYGYGNSAVMYGPKFTSQTSTLAGDVMERVGDERRLGAPEPAIATDGAAPVEVTNAYSTGAVQSTGQLLDGEMHGDWAFYRKDGSDRSGAFDRGAQVCVADFRPRRPPGEGDAVPGIDG